MRRYPNTLLPSRRTICEKLWNGRAKTNIFELRAGAIFFLSFSFFLFFFFFFFNEKHDGFTCRSEVQSQNESTGDRDDVERMTTERKQGASSNHCRA
jgi:hypothetical protein